MKCAPPSVLAAAFARSKTRKWCKNTALDMGTEAGCFCNLHTCGFLGLFGSSAFIAVQCQRGESSITTDCLPMAAVNGHGDCGCIGWSFSAGFSREDGLRDTGFDIMEMEKSCNIFGFDLRSWFFLSFPHCDRLLIDLWAMLRGNIRREKYQKTPKKCILDSPSIKRRE